MSDAALAALLDRLNKDIDRLDGAAALHTLDLISVLAGREYAIVLMHQLITDAIARLARH